MQKSFGSLAQRIAYGILATFPPFSPAPTCDATEESQRQAHAFLRGVAEKLAEDPGIIGLPGTPDGAFGDWELFKTKPELIDEMRRLQRKLEEFYELLCRLGDAATVEGEKLAVSKAALKVPPKAVKALEALGVACDSQKDGLTLWSEEYPDLAAGWKALASIAQRSGGNPGFLFSRAIFNPARPRTVETFRALAEDKAAFDALVCFFEKNGYRLVELREGAVVDWVKTYGKKDEPLKWHWAERVHGGLSIVYDGRRANPVIFGLRLPMYRELLAHFDGMGDDVKDLVVEHTKKCDGCRYCVQTDKTGQRPRQVVPVRHRGADYELCTLFTGFSYIWTKVDQAEAGRMIGLLKFIDGVFSTSTTR